jgi:phosphoheptose isomerase
MADETKKAVVISDEMSKKPLNEHEKLTVSFIQSMIVNGLHQGNYDLIVQEATAHADAFMLAREGKTYYGERHKKDPKN